MTFQHLGYIASCVKRDYGEAMRFKPRAKKWNWKAYLTPDEAFTIKLCDEINADIAKMRKRPVMLERTGIVNRAIQRAKYAEQKESSR